MPRVTTTSMYQVQVTSRIYFDATATFELDATDENDAKKQAIEYVKEHNKIKLICKSEDDVITWDPIIVNKRFTYHTGEIKQLSVNSVTGVTTVVDTEDVTEEIVDAEDDQTEDVQ